MSNGDTCDLLVSDSDRFEALGNSFPVPVVNWIGRSLDRAVGVSS